MTNYARFRPLFAQALDPRLHPIEYLDQLLFSQQAQIWFGDNSAIVTEIRTYPSGNKVIEGLIAAGDATEIIETLIPKAEEWGKSIGCILARIESRKGWIRKLKDHGWAIQQTALVKEL